MAKFTVSCGTLVVNPRGELLLCHVTDTPKWDIPKGMRDPGETELAEPQPAEQGGEPGEWSERVAGEGTGPSGPPFSEEDPNKAGIRIDLSGISSNNKEQ